jgi:uncharacterized Zn-binding protein involved in type VI secretion
MSGQPAARVGDTIACAIPQATPAALPHAPPPGLPIMPPGAPTVLIGGQPAARVTDKSICIAPAPTPNPVVKGSFPVPISNFPAARMTDQGTHPGSVIMPPCCPTVLIGLAGTAGNVRVGTAMCNAAAAGRTSGTTAQSYNNCGVESSRQVINQANGTAVSENQLLQNSINSGLANGTPGSPPVFANGGTTPARRQQILANNGVASTVQASNLDSLGMAMSRGQGTIASLDAAPLWGGTTAPGSLHAVTVTGVEYDDAGNVKNVIINDTGTGNCGQVVPVATWNSAVGAHPSPALNVTTNPIL